MVMTSDGRCAPPPGMFSASGRYATTFTAGPSSAMACTAASTAAAPLMSAFIVSIAFGGLSERPPESNVMPLPANTTVRARAQPRRMSGTHAHREDAAEALLGEIVLVEHLHA